MQKLKIDVTKIDKTAMFTGAKGIYLDLTLKDNRDGRNAYGDDGFIIQDIGKERRLAGEKGPIIGNWRHLEIRTSAHSANQPAPAAAQDDDDEEIPF